MNTKPFASEAQLVRSGRRVLKAALAQLDETVKAKYEVRGPGVVPDLVLFTKRSETVLYVVTVEFKLRNWQRALVQAFKHRNFGNEAYVVLDDAHVASAVQNLSLFEEANVGLVSVARCATVHFWHFPIPSVPFSVAFSRALARSLLFPHRTLPSDLPFTRTTRGGVPLADLRSTRTYQSRLRSNGGMHLSPAFGGRR